MDDFINHLQKAPLSDLIRHYQDQVKQSIEDLQGDLSETERAETRHNQAMGQHVLEILNRAVDAVNQEVSNPVNTETESLKSIDKNVG